MLTWIYAFMIRLYPRSFRQTFEDEMKGVFAQSLTEARRRGGWASMGLFLREMCDLPYAVIHAHYHERGWMMSSKAINRMYEIILLFLIPSVVATILNFAQWNYLFIPPSLDPLITDFSSVDSLGYYDLEPHSDRSGYMAINGNPARGEYGFNSSTANAFIVDYDMHRVPRWALTQGVDRITPLDERTLTQLESLITQASWSIETPHRATVLDNVPAYAASLFPVGYVMQGRDKNGNDLVLMSMVRCISGDSYGYHEALFQMSDDGPILLKTNNYNYDDAGVEFAQWPFWFFIVFLVCYVAFLIGHLVAWIWNRLFSRANDLESNQFT
ncbi:hypothetical protein VZO05_13060 [Aggregatilineales bacterium SYSU G02658]